MGEPFIGEIRLFPFDFAPTPYWLPCDGRVLAISEFQSVYSLLGNAYGGDGRTTFALPDYRGRTPVSFGESGHKMYVRGKMGGQERVSLPENAIPAHTHTIRVTSSEGNTGVASETCVLAAVKTVEADGKTEAYKLYSDADTDTTLTADKTLSASASNNQPHDNVQPSLALTFCIAVKGLYPPRE